MTSPTTQVPARRDSTLPSVYLAAKRALAECARLDECKDWADKNAALAVYARQSKDQDLFDQARRIQARATRRMGELLVEFDARGGDSKVQGDPKFGRTEAARKAGLSAHQQPQAVAVANVPESEFECLIEADHPPTVTKLAEIGTKSKKKPEPEKWHDPETGRRVEPEPTIAADEKRRAALAATNERKEAERIAAKELEVLQVENNTAELMGLLAPYLTPEEINRVFELVGALSWRWGYEGFTYDGHKYGGDA